MNLAILFVSNVQTHHFSSYSSLFGLGDPGRLRHSDRQWRLAHARNFHVSRWLKTQKLPGDQAVAFFEWEQVRLHTSDDPENGWGPAHAAV